MIALMKMKTKLFKFQRTLISDFQMELNFVYVQYTEYIYLFFENLIRSIANEHFISI